MAAALFLNRRATDEGSRFSLGQGRGLGLRESSEAFLACGFQNWSGWGGRVEGSKELPAIWMACWLY